jgi:uncharacterized MAPEG superfamily protein
MSTELLYLTYTTLLTAICWVPYILNTIAVRGLSDAVGYPENPAPLAPWAQRLKSAHYNAVENLVVFAALVLTANALDIHSGATAISCIVYFWARLVHMIVYALGIPWLRTVSFAVAFAAQVCIAYQILAS